LAIRRAKFAQFMYGFYPASEQWRVNLTYALGATLLVPLLVPRAPHKALNAILFFGVLSGRGVLPAGRRRVRLAACGNPPLGRAPGHARHLVHRHHLLAAARHLLALGRRSELPIVRTPASFHRVLARRPADHGLFFATYMLPFFLPGIGRSTGCCAC
jgi:general L-amino acid transport system permease protein